jgi:uncharacterized protein YecE (DUF72 family)
VIYVGTSGWQYRSWKGRFYPKDLPQGRWLEHYASRFPVVEVNNSFYRLPEESTVDRWRKVSPPGFTFVVKASRYITHVFLTDQAVPGCWPTDLDCGCRRS